MAALEETRCHYRSDSLDKRSAELDTELSWRVFPHGHIIIGAENLNDEIRYTAGFRLAAKNW